MSEVKEVGNLLPTLGTIYLGTIYFVGNLLPTCPLCLLEFAIAKEQARVQEIHFKGLIEEQGK